LIEMRKGTGIATAAAAVLGLVGGLGISRLVKSPEPTATAPTAHPITAAAKPPVPTKANLGPEIYKVPVGNAPVKGGEQPKVTIIAFSEFQCPFCGRVAPTLEKVLKTYGKDVQVAFKHYPLPFHPNAMPAAIAAEAAKEQGKFWQMHDKLFANQQNLDRASLEKYAQELGLDMTKFKAALDTAKNKDVIEANMKEGTNFGVRGTPSFFINGRFFRGAQPYDSFKLAIDEELKKADEKLKSGVSRAGLYAAITKDGLDKVAAPAAPPARPGEPQAGTAYKVDLGDAPIKGAKDALVTIVQYSDFQCPFCSRVEPTVDQVMKEYNGKVRVAWKDLPLPFHQNAMPAALAARAAKDQGKFWEMHDKLFANQQNLDRASLEKYAQELGLNMARFKAALDSKKHEAEIQADSASGNKIGANGTPAFFINGTSLSGAQPFEAFKARIDEELKKAEALVAKGTPKAKVYDAIMKTAQSGVAAAPAAQAEPAGPEMDSKVWPVTAGSSPAKGPKNAPITVVVFSDFQCPFCGRVEPTLAKLDSDYPGKIRFVWKNFPLSFHQNAKPAAVAALAAGEQGKFWEMHDKLFANQTALDRASLEKYAQELHLDLGKFKAALDSNKYEAQIAADMKEGSAVDVSGTPASFINGRKIGGAYPYETFKKVVDQELAKKGTVAERRRRG
jgi:protein-disulfide isomerase